MVDGQPYGRNKDFLYSSVVTKKEANLNINQKELPARDCIKDGEYFELKNRNDPLLAHSYKNALDSVLRILVVSAISATTVTSDVLHHHVFDQHTQSWQQRPAKKKPFVKVTIKVDKNSARELGAKRVNVKTQVITDRALPDTGASVTLSGTKLMRNTGRVVIPVTLWPMVLETLHSAHQGVTGMTLRAQTSVWWPGITPQIKETRDKCRVCNECAPSQPSSPPEPLKCPDYPFQQLASDYFQLGGYHYLVIVDRFSSWPAVQFCGASTGSSRQLQEWLRQYFATYGIPEEIATDGGLYMSYETQKFLADYGVKHRLSSVAFAQSNKRAELGVKSMKRLIRENTGSDGSLTNDRFLQALMTYRNTPDRNTSHFRSESEGLPALSADQIQAPA